MRTRIHKRYPVAKRTVTHRELHRDPVRGDPYTTDVYTVAVEYRDGRKSIIRLESDYKQRVSVNHTYIGDLGFGSWDPVSIFEYVTGFDLDWLARYCERKELEELARDPFHGHDPYYGHA